MMPARKACGPGYVLKDDWACFYKPACGDGTVLAIELSLLRASIGHSAGGLLHPVLLPGQQSPCASDDAEHEKRRDRASVLSH